MRYELVGDRLLGNEYSIGVDSRIMTTVYARQKSENWCWAACIEMALRAQGPKIDQKFFAADLCGVSSIGTPKDCPANPNEMTIYLNGCGNDEWGREFCTRAYLQEGNTLNEYVFDNLQMGYPIIAAYRIFGQPVGHAVLITGAKIKTDLLSGEQFITHLILRDPANNLYNVITGGRRVVSATEFVPNVYAWWVPEVYCPTCY